MLPSAAAADDSAAADARLLAIEQEEAEKRAEKEKLLRAVVYVQMLGDFQDAFENAEVYYYCLDGVDYVAASDGAKTRIYLPRITKSGEYFLADEEAGDAAAEEIAGLLDEAHRTSTEEFWNKIALAEKPEPEAHDPHPVDQNGVMLVPYYNQGSGYYEDGNWTHTDWPSTCFYNGRTLQQVGCGFTAVAMALSYCLQDMVAPTDLMNGPDYNGNGADGTVGVNAAAAYGVPAYQTGDFDTAISELRDGHPVMVFVGQSAFTNGTHYILLVGILPDGSIAVSDPGKYWNSYFVAGVSFSPDYIRQAAIGGSGTYTIFG